jgi:hypothetical protein
LSTRSTFRNHKRTKRTTRTATTKINANPHPISSFFNPKFKIKNSKSLQFLSTRSTFRNHKRAKRTTRTATTKINANPHPISSFFNPKFRIQNSESFQTERDDNGIVEKGTERSDFDVVRCRPDPVAEQDDGKLFFRVDPDACSGKSEMAV